MGRSASFTPTTITTPKDGGEPTVHGVFDATLLVSNLPASSGTPDVRLHVVF